MPLTVVKVDLIHLSRLLVPICYSNHWLLLVRNCMPFCSCLSFSFQEFNFDCHKVVSYDSLVDQFSAAGVTEIG